MNAHALRRLMARGSNESGFTIVEAMVALAVLSLVFVSLSMSLLGALKADRDSRLRQQATGLGSKAMEAGRDLQYDQLSMTTSDLSGDSLIVSSRYDPDGSGALASEAVVATTAGGAIDPHITTETLGNTAFTVKRYVTWVDADTQGGSGQDYKRLTTVVSWTSGSGTHTYRASSLVTDALRGLPAPSFEVSPAAQQKTLAPGSTVTFAHTVQNLGAEDTYDVSMPVPTGRTWTIQFYDDVNQDGTLDGGDTLLTDTNGSGTVDTGQVATGVTSHFLVTWTLSGGEATGTVELTLTVASSTLDPDVEETATDTLRIQNPGTTLYLHNNPTPPTANTTAQSNLAMNTTAPTATTLRQYSTNYYTGTAAGRYVDKSTSTSGQTATNLMANWVWQVPTTTTYNGEVDVTLWVAMKDMVCDKSPSIQVFLRDKSTSTSTTGTEFGSATGTLSAPGGTPPCDFRQITLTMTVNQTITTNRWIEFKVTTQDAAGDAVMFAYDTTAHPSTVTVPG